MSGRRRWQVIVEYYDGDAVMEHCWTKRSAVRAHRWWSLYLARIYWPFPPRVSISRTEATR
jgi:hypothetical protein